MPISGRFYTSSEIQDLIKVSRQRVRNLARTYHWYSPHPGLYLAGPAEDSTTVDAYLFARWRAEIAGKSMPIWDDSYDLDCPECGAFAVEVEGGRWKCIRGHSGEMNGA